MDERGSATGIPGARRPGGRTAHVRATVHEAVRVLLVERGYDGLSVDRVAERSGVHRTTVYRRWRDVGGLLADLFDAGAGDEWGPVDTGSLERDLAALNHEVFEALTAEPPFTLALITASFRSGQAAAALRAFWRDRYERCGVVVRNAVARGEIPAQSDPYRLLVTATAPLYHRIVLLGERIAPEVSDQAAHDAAVAAKAGAFAANGQPRQ